MTPTELFYENDVFVDELDYQTLDVRVAGDAPPTASHRGRVAFPALSLMGTAIVGLIAIGSTVPASWSAPDRAALEQLYHRASVPIVEAPTAHIAAASRFSRLSRTVPADNLQDPDYDL